MVLTFQKESNGEKGAGNISFRTFNGHKVRITNRTSGAVILDEAEVAHTFWRRLLGLLGKDQLEWGRGMVIHPCRSVHTLGMAFPIDVAFVDRQGRLCCILEKMKPGRFSPSVRDAVYVIEAPAGTFRETGTRVQDEVTLEKVICNT